MAARILKRLAIFLALAALGILLLTTAGLLWLGTPSATRFAETQLRQALETGPLRQSLEAAGLRLDFATLEGPLPGELRLRGVTVADAQGIWLELPDILLRLNVADLARWTLRVDALHLDQGRLLRLPELPPSPPSPPEAALAWVGNLTTLNAELPTLFRRLAPLPRLELADLRFALTLEPPAWKVLQPLIGEPPQTSVPAQTSVPVPASASPPVAAPALDLPAAQPPTLATPAAQPSAPATPDAQAPQVRLTGSLTFSASEGLRSTLALRCGTVETAKDDAADMLRAKAQLPSPGSGAIAGAGDARESEQSDQSAAALLRPDMQEDMRPKLRADLRADMGVELRPDLLHIDLQATDHARNLELTFSGNAPLADWKGVLHLRGGNWGTVRGETSWRLEANALLAAVDMRATPGPALLVALNTTKISTPAGAPAADPASDPAGPPTRVAANSAANSADQDAQQGTTTARSTAPPSPLLAGSLVAAPAPLSEKSSLDTPATLPENTSPQNTSTDPLAALPEIRLGDLQATASLRLTAENLRVKNLRVQAAEISLHGEGQWTPGAALSAEARLDLDRAGLAALAPLDPALAFLGPELDAVLSEGRGTLHLALHMPPLPAAANQDAAPGGSAAVTVATVGAPAGATAGVSAGTTARASAGAPAGAPAGTSADTSGPTTPAAPASTAAQSTTSGPIAAAVPAVPSPTPSPTLAGTLRLELRDLVWTPATLHALLGPTLDLNATFSLPDADDLTISTLRLEAASLRLDGEAHLAGTELQSDLQLQVPDLARLLPDAGYGGPLDLALRAKGPVDAPALTLTLSCPKMRLSDLDLTKALLEIQTPALHSNGTGEGSLRYEASLQGQPLKGDLHWKLAPDRLLLRDVALHGAGLRLNGNTDLHFAGPRLGGALQLDLVSPAALSALTRTLGLSLRVQELRLNADFSPNRPTQDLTLNAQIRNLELDNTLRLRELTAQASLNDLFGALKAKARITSQGGQIMDSGWRRAELTLEGSPDKGQLSLSSEGRLSATLRLRYAPESLWLDVLRLRETRHGVGLSLAAPAQVDFGQKGTRTRLDLRFEPAGRLDIDAALSAQAPRLSLRLRDLALSTLKPFLPFPLPDGTLEATARYDATGARPQGEALIEAVNLRFPNTAQPPLTLSLTGRLQRKGALPALFLRLDAKGLEARTFDAELLLPLTASLAPASAAALTGHLRWEGAVAPLWSFVPLADRRLSGEGSLDARLSGTLNAPRVVGSLSLRDGIYNDLVLGVMLRDLRLNLNAGPNGARLQASGGDGQGGKLDVDGDVGAPEAGLPLRLAIRLDDLKPLRRADLRCSLSGSATVDGTPAAPSITADILVNRGELLLAKLPGSGITTLPVEVKQADAPLAPAPASAPKSATKAAPKSTTKTPSKAGRAAKPPTTAARATKSPTAPTATPSGAAGRGTGTSAGTVTAASDPTVSMAGSSAATGTAAGSTANSAVVDSRSASGMTAAESTAAPDDMPPADSLNLRVRVPGRFFVRGMGMESEWKGDIRVYGALTAPRVVGSLNSVRGQVELLGKTFVLQRGSVLFDGLPTPRLDVQLTCEASDITATAEITGSATQPKFSLSSQPPLPQDEVVARVLFGRTMRSLSPVEALQLASTVASLTGFGSGSSLLDLPRTLLGLDVLRMARPNTRRETGRPTLFGQNQTQTEDENSAPALELGKYVLDNVYVGVEQGLGPETSGVRVDVEIAPNLHLEGRTTPRSSEIGLDWKKNY